MGAAVPKLAVPVQQTRGKPYCRLWLSTSALDLGCFGREELKSTKCTVWLDTSALWPRLSGFKAAYVKWALAGGTGVWSEFVDCNAELQIGIDLQGSQIRQA